MANESASRNSTAAPRKMFPIQGGPAVPWEVMAPHEHQAQSNHSQTLQRLAERGGLGTAEAWAVIQGENLEFGGAWWTERDKLWRAYAERINLHYDELDRLRAAVSERGTLKYTDAIVDAPRMLIAYADKAGRTLQGLREHLRAAGVKFEHCWPDWGYENGHLNKAMIAELVHRFMEAARSSERPDSTKED